MTVIFQTRDYDKHLVFYFHADCAIEHVTSQSFESLDFNKFEVLQSTHITASLTNQPLWFQIGGLEGTFYPYLVILWRLRMVHVTSLLHDVKGMVKKLKKIPREQKRCARCPARPLMVLSRKHLFLGTNYTQSSNHRLHKNHHCHTTNII